MIRVTGSGDGRPWVLVPGTLCTGAVFDGFLDAVGVPKAARLVVPLVHARVQDYLPELCRLAHPDAILCGFSLGAIVLAHLVDQLPARQTLLFGLNPRADDPAKRASRLSLALNVADHGGAGALASRMAPLAGPGSAQGLARILAMADETAGQIAAQTDLALTRPGAFAALGHARHPITFLTGTEDTQAPLALAHEASAATPQGRVVPLSGLGHYALIEDPVACAEAMRPVWSVWR